MFEEWVDPDKEVAVVGLARSGVAVSELLARHGVRVYASDKARAVTDADIETLGGMGVAMDLGAHDLVRIGRSVALVVSLDYIGKRLDGYLVPERRRFSGSLSLHPQREVELVGNVRKRGVCSGLIIVRKCHAIVD